MITVQVVAFAWLIVILVYFSTLTIGSRYITVIRSSDGDYFTNPDENCNSNSCDSYNSTTVGGYCVSSDECCRQCRCGFHAKTYIIRAKRCMSLDEIRQYEVIQTTNEIKYFLGQLGISCSETCNTKESVCIAKGHGFTRFTTTLSIFRSVSVKCKAGPFPDTDTYQYPDNPAYVVEGDGGWHGRCIGFKNVNETIDCTAGGNPDIQRLCPCKGYRDGGYYFVEHYGVSWNSCENIPVIDLSTNGSIRLSICKNRGSVALALSKCTVKEVTYMHSSNWVSLGKDKTSAFEVTRDHQPVNIVDRNVLKWDSSLGEGYNGILGFIKVECKGQQKPVSFIFKSNGTMTTEPKHQLSTTSTPVTYGTSHQLSTPTTQVLTGEFDKNIGDDSSSTAIAVAVTASVVLLIVICVIGILVIRRRHRQSEERRNEMTQSNPTYGKGPDNTVMLRAAGGASGNAGKGKKDFSNSSAMQQDTYEVIRYEAVNKKQNDTNGAAPVLNPDTYETIDTVIEPTYHYADREDMVGQTPKQQSIYSSVKETNNPQQDNVYNVLARPELLGSEPVHGNDAPRYDVLKRDQTTEGGYDDDNHVYHYAK